MIVASTVVAELAAQHAHLRRLLDRCDALLAAIDAGEVGAAALAAEVRRLRQAFTDHQAFEDDHLALFGPTDGHRDHHADLAAGLADDPAVLALAVVLRDLRAHLTHEDALLAALMPST